MYTHGVSSALHQYGLNKLAFGLADLKGLVIGDPGRVKAELAAGTLFSRQGSIAQSMNPHVPGKPWHTALNVGMNYALPAYGLYQAAQAPASQRGSVLGGAIGGLAGGLIGTPLGLAGNIAGGLGGAALGEGIGRLFNEHTPRVAPSGAPPRPHTSAPAQTTQAPLSSDMSAITQRPTSFGG